MTSPPDLVEVKADLLVNGIAPAPGIPGEWKQRTEHLYQHDGGRGPAFAYPQEIVISYDEDSAGATVVNVRYNRESPWALSMLDGQLTLSHTEWGVLLPATPVSRPEYYGQRDRNGITYESVVQHLGTDAVGVIPNNYCYYFKDGAECRFCEIEPSFKAAVGFPRHRKPLDEIVEALRFAIPKARARHLNITAGNLRRNDRTAEYYCRILEGIDARNLHGVYRFGSLMAPESFEKLDELQEAGLQGVAFNLEFHDRGQFARLAPGKDGYGYDKLIEVLQRSVEVFGEGNVYSNMVFGIQTWGAGDGFNASAEVEACLAATEDLLGKSVLPLFTLYHTSGKNRIGRVAITTEAVTAFHRSYAEAVAKCGLVPPDRTGVLFNRSTIANHLYNDAYHELVQAPAQFHAALPPTTQIGNHSHG